MAIIIIIITHVICEQATITDDEIMQEVLNDKDTNSEQTMNRNCSIKGSPTSKSTRQITVLKS